MVLWWEGVGDRTELQYIDPRSYGRQRCVFLVLQGCSTGGLGAHSAGFLYCILSLTGLVPKLHWGSRGPLRPVMAFPTTSRLYSVRSLTVWLLVLIELYNSSRPLNRPLNLWNGMFDRHQAEITVMQFRGHSLPVYQSMSVPWDFLPCPISSAKHTYAISSHNCHWNLSLPSGASLWNDKFGRVEGQNTTPRQTFIHCRYRDILYLRYKGICVLVRILYLCYDLSLTVYLCLSMLWSIVLTLNVAICIVLLHLRYCVKFESES